MEEPEKNLGIISWDIAIKHLFKPGTIVECMEKGEDFGRKFIVPNDMETNYYLSNLIDFKTGQYCKSLFHPNTFRKTEGQ